MQVLVFGAGGVGGYFGAQLARAGHEVMFVARGAHLAAMRERGLRVDSAVGPARLQPVRASDDPAAMTAPDVVLFCPKLWDVRAAAEQLAPSLSPTGVVVPFQNGVESHRWLADRLGAHRVAGGVAHIAATIREPGVIAHTGTMARLRVGTLPQGPDAAPAVDALVAAGQAAGIDIQRSDDIERTLWEKFVMLVALSGLTCLARQPVGVVRADEDLRATFEGSMRETAALARARGIDLGAGFVAKQLQFVDGLPFEMRSSMLNDLLGGRRLEAEWLAGGVARMAREAGLDTPVNRTLYAALKPYLGGGAP